MPDYNTVTVSSGDTYNLSLSGGDSLTNTLIDITADNADVDIDTSGSGWTIRNVGIKGKFDIGDDSPGGDDSSYEGGSNTVFKVRGDGVIESLYVPGIVPGVDKSCLLADDSHDGHIDIRNVWVGGFSTSCFYVSGFGREDTGGTMTIENSYFENSAGTAHIRPAGNVTIRNCTITNTNEGVYIPRTFGGLTQAMTSRGIWTSYNGPTTLVERCDIDVREENTCSAPWDYSGPCQANAVWAGEADIELRDCEVRGTVGGSGGNVSQTRVGSNPDLSPPDRVPLDPVEAASGGSESGNDSGGDNNDTMPTLEVVDTSGESTEYEIVVDGSVEPGEEANTHEHDYQDTITENDDGTVTIHGWVANEGSDTFNTDGGVVNITVYSGSCDLTLDGKQLDPANYPLDDGGDESSEEDVLSEQEREEVSQIVQDAYDLLMEEVQADIQEVDDRVASIENLENDTLKNNIEEVAQGQAEEETSSLTQRIVEALRS